MDLAIPPPLHKGQKTPQGQVIPVEPTWSPLDFLPATQDKRNGPGSVLLIKSMINWPRPFEPW